MQNKQVSFFKTRFAFTKTWFWILVFKMSDNKIHCNRNVYVEHGWTQEVGREVGGTFFTPWQNKNAIKH